MLLESTCITPQIISLSISSCGASLLITVVWLMDMSFSQHFSCPGSGSFLFLPSPLILMFAICGWLSCQFPSIFVIPPLSLCWLLCHFFSFDSLGHTHFSPFPLHSNGYCPREAWELAPDHWLSVIVVVVKSFQGKFFSSLRDSACEYCCHSKW